MEHRAHPRRKTLKHGSLVLKPGGAKVDCVVRDISAGGARIWRPHWVRLPRRFQLTIPGEINVKAELCWENGQEAGLRFVGSGTAFARQAFGRRGARAA
ncbi:MAG TPA: PilZ domain-containing protein [Afifellaceae bacterium]|nr:PilZ domain-containing protein [Afifellaceae bacterium]